MKTKLVVDPHTEVDIVNFAELLGISLERARYIENMRATYLSEEHNYTYNTKGKGSKKAKTKIHV